MKYPNYATVVMSEDQDSQLFGIRPERKFSIDVIHFDTQQITLQERKNVYLTVDIKNVIFDYSDMTETEINEFKSKLC